ncbi:hypothetical protein RhiLY_08455 [Ceratobasidium sp. AG-Ba]|nr:hypothetical protein RhiLY_08455 [Ceratobasidium sp. AG-Ba]
MQTRAEAAGDVSVVQLATVAMLRARVVSCTEGIVDDIGSEKLEDSMRRAEAELGITSTQAGGTEEDKSGKALAAKTVMADASNRAQPPSSSPLPHPTLPPPPSSKPGLPTPQHSTPAIPSESAEPEPSIFHLRAHVLFLGIALAHAILDSGQLEYEDECFCGLRQQANTSHVGAKKDAPTVDKLGEDDDEEEKETCPCVRSFVLPLPLNKGDRLMVRTTHLV